MDSTWGKWVGGIDGQGPSPEFSMEESIDTKPLSSVSPELGRYTAGQPLGLGGWYRAAWFIPLPQASALPGCNPEVHPCFLHCTQL